MQEIGIESSVLNDIIEGKKTFEARLGKPKFLKVREGDRLSLREDVWADGRIVDSIPNKAVIVITQVLYFENFVEMLEAINYEQVIPSAKNAQEASDAYGLFYSKEDETEYGVVAFEFKLL